MTKDDIIKLVLQVRDPEKVDPRQGGFWVLTLQELERFANLVAEHEREECAQIVDEFGDEWMCDSHMLSKQIRARGNT
jgi:hypothetical protein